MELIKKYIIVQNLDNKYNINAIPQIWLFNNTNPNIGEICDWYWPPEIPIKNSECYVPTNCR